MNRRNQTRRSWLRWAACLVVLLLHSVIGSAPAHAQELRTPAARQGYYLGGGLRYGISAADADNVGDLGALSHLGFMFRLGQKPTPWFGVGLQLGGGGDTNDVWTLGYGHLMLDLQLEPFDFDLAFRASAGLGGGPISRVDEASEQIDDPEFMFGAMFAAGVSYDWFPFYDPKAFGSGGPALTFFLEGRFFPAGDVTTGGGFVGIEFTWWTGLDRRKLELPLEKAFDE